MITTGLIGDPVAHSVSPAMHNAAFAHYGLPDRYTLWPTPAAALSGRIAALRAVGMRGANVTLPHKTAVIALLDELDPVAAAVGAVNTIVRLPDGRLRGLNTDVAGFLRALAQAGVDAAGRTALLLGAGGAARAVGYGLIMAGVAALVVANRTPARAAALVDDLRTSAGPATRLTATALDDDALGAALAEADVLINATSAGLHAEALPVPEAALGPRLLVVDLIYRTTPLLRAAAARGARTQDGLEMLVQQGALAFEAWTGLAAPLEVMRAAAHVALKEQV
ncbi:shikimate dehydrogenase [Kallotenue papyrolyticum]|uniref:shikimate dehydrogenase n=1 Tax=Kallotenue papyrolyticum TaxID=1325125 RepID=UPI0004786782|nr:shikimate dehydrogenase [Kallotenue papyrolyticum]